MNSKHEVPASLENIKARLTEIGFPRADAIPDPEYKKQIRELMERFVMGKGVLIVRHCMDETLIEVR